MPHSTPSRDPRIHHHALVERTVVVAPRRAERPGDLGGAPTPDDRCPFCAGNEERTPPAVIRMPEAGDRPWHARVIPNRYPIVEPLADRTIRDAAARPAHGVHEVVVESPAHCRSILEVDPQRWREVWQLVHRRLAMLAATPGIEWATVFKNAGPAAGASLEHVHSQIVGLDFVPPAMRSELSAVGQAGQSFADLIRGAEDRGCVVATAADLVALIPPAPRQPFETWILPRGPEPLFSSPVPERVAALADLTRDVVARLGRAAPGADYNWWLHQAPFGGTAAAMAGVWHWHLEILPRLAPLAGFELGTGCHITTASPEESARRLLENGLPSLSAV